MTAGSDYVRARISDFASSVVAISAKFTPPGKNAANGIFRDTLVKDPHIADCGAAPTVVLEGDDKALFDIYKAFYDGVFGAFHDNANHEAKWDTNIKLLYEARTIIGDIALVCKDIVTMIYGSAPVGAAMILALGKDIEKLVNDVNSLDNKLDGTHANGNISLGVNSTVVKIDQSLDRAWADDDAKTASAFRRACQALATLDTKDNNPWLRAEWQVRFQGIMDGLGRALAAQ